MKKIIYTGLLVVVESVFILSAMFLFFVNENLFRLVGVLVCLGIGLVLIYENSNYKKKKDNTKERWNEKCVL